VKNGHRTGEVHEVATWEDNDPDPPGW